MNKSERRITPRFHLNTPLSFHRMEAISEHVQGARAINISSRGIYFAATQSMLVGEAIEILLKMPKRITGHKSAMRRFTARVAHIETANMPRGHSGIGVQLLYYEPDLAPPAIGTK